MSLFYTQLNNSLKNSDPDIFSAVSSELFRQQNQIELIASENILSMCT